MGGISVGTVTSGGTLTLQAAGPIALTKLVSTGGDVDMISTASTITGGTVVAHGSDNFAAYGNNIGPSVTSQTGSITLSSQVGIVDWGLDTAATSFTATGGGGVVVNQGTATTTFTATSGMGGISVGTVTSGGTLTLQAAGPIALTKLVSTGGDVDMISTASTITGGTVVAHGSGQLRGLRQQHRAERDQPDRLDHPVLAGRYRRLGAEQCRNDLHRDQRHGRHRRRHGDERRYADLAIAR